MCPSHLYTKLSELPEVATGKISFEELENLITLAVHSKWDKRTGLNALESADGTEDVQFELGGDGASVSSGKGHIHIQKNLIYFYDF